MCKWRGIERTKSQSEGKRCGEEVVRINEEYRRLNDATEASAERLSLWDYPAAMRNKAVLFWGSETTYEFASSPYQKERNQTCNLRKSGRQ
jgi:hypothetical protein